MNGLVVIILFCCKWLSPFFKRVQNLLMVRPSSLLMLCRCISSSMASKMILSMYPFFTERNFVSLV
jgi:hypothetical protein